MVAPEPEVLVLASGNPGKLREITALLGPLGFRVAPQSDWQVSEAAETAPTFLENALIKARHAAVHTGHAALADDSGLVVPALDGAPGVHSARYSDGRPRDAANNAKLLGEMRDLKAGDRRAFFYCVLVMLRAADDPEPLVASARWWGEILDAPRGTGGFGYDPLFYVPSEDRSSAELPADLKNRLSHRGQALAKLVEKLRRSDGR